MGMAASQARLLTLTARLADNELRSQTINNAKMRLATQSAQASDNYINALNNADLMFSNYDETGMEQSQLLTFNALTAYSSYNNQYGLVNAAGQLLVSESEAKIFEKANGNLNAYLQDHGLVYDTTYFDQLNDIDNKGIYPDPYNTISMDTLKGWYEAYGSMEHSNENVLYGQKYDDYSMSLNSLKKALNPAFKEYIENSTPSINKTTDPVSLIFLPTMNADRMIELLKGCTDNINRNYLTDDAVQELDKLLNSAEKVTSTVTNADGTVSTSTFVKVKDPEQGVTFGTDTDTGNKTVTIQGNTWSYSVSGGSYTLVSVPQNITDDETGAVETSFTMPTTTTYSSIKGLIQALSYTEHQDSGASTFKFDFDGDETDGTVTPYALIPTGNRTAIEEALSDIAASIYILLNSSDSMNVDNIIEDLEAGTSPLNPATEYDGKQLTTYVNEYMDNRNDFLEFIFAQGAADVITMLKSGAVEAKDLTNTDFILKLVKANSGLKLTNEYNTIVQDMFVAMQIEATGEPKYAWIDQNDISNKGNADAKAQWYTNLFSRMRDGYKAIENGLASSSEWLEFALESGLVSMEQVDKNFNWKSLDYKTCAKITEQTDNSAAVAKAEAEYTRAMNDIDAKDSMYDMQLKNIDTEHSALQTEYESIKTVLNKNIERTFKFSQNG